MPEPVGGFEQDLNSDLAQKIDAWCRCRRDLVTWEREHLLDGAPPADKLGEHKRMVERLIFFGQVFSLATSHPDSPESLSQQVHANLFALRSAYQMFHNPMDPAEADALLKEVFPES